MHQVTIIGLGNPLMKDDGIGPRLIKELHKGGLPNGVQAVEGDGSIFQHWNLLARSRYVIAVDAMQAGETPGTVYLLTPGDLVRQSENGPFRHEDDFFSALELLASFGIKPEVCIVGVEPKEIDYSLELSPEISAEIPALVKIVRELCARGMK